MGNCQSMSSFLKRALRLEGPQLTQRTITIKKNVRESLGMRIGGGIGSNEGDTPIYVANIHPHGCIGKSKQLKVRTYSIYWYFTERVTHNTRFSNLSGLSNFDNYEYKMYFKFHFYLTLFAEITSKFRFFEIFGKYECSK